LFSSSSVHNFDDEREPIPITTEEDLNAPPQIPGFFKIKKIFFWGIFNF